MFLFKVYVTSKFEQMAPTIRFCLCLLHTTRPLLYFTILFILQYWRKVFVYFHSVSREAHTKEGKLYDLEFRILKVHKKNINLVMEQMELKLLEICWSIFYIYISCSTFLLILSSSSLFCTNFNVNFKMVHKSCGFLNKFYLSEVKEREREMDFMVGPLRVYAVTQYVFISTKVGPLCRSCSLSPPRRRRKQVDAAVKTMDKVSTIFRQVGLVGKFKIFKIIMALNLSINLGKVRLKFRPASCSS